jgi:TatA/E family protein of Tat protein translocase
MPTPGPLELVIILVIALIILGPGKLPDVGAAHGKSIREFRKASSDIQEAATVQVDTSPLPPDAAAGPAAQPAPTVEAPIGAPPAVPTPVAESGASAAEADARIAELERQLEAARAQQNGSTPVTAGSTTAGASTDSPS